VLNVFVWSRVRSVLPLLMCLFANMKNVNAHVFKIMWTVFSKRTACLELVKLRVKYRDISVLSTDDK
jgi:hypothetical protein